MTERVSPHNLDAEKSVLGSILIGGIPAALRASEAIGPDDFFRDAHRILFRGALALAEQGSEIDYITLKSVLTPKELDDAGGPAYILGLADGVPRSANVEHYARIVREASLLRQMAAAGTKIAALAHEPGSDARDLLDEAERTIFAIAEDRLGAGLMPIADVAATATAAIENLHLLKDNSGVSGLPTGFVDLDRMLSGLQPADLVLVAARPSMGKTALVLNVADTVARHAPVAFFSLEMSREALYYRELAGEAKIDAQRFRSALLDEPEMERLAQAIRTVRGRRLFIDDTSSPTVLDIRAKARRMQAEHGLALIVVDYVQLMAGRGRSENRQLEISGISRGLKALAKELHVPVVALSQLSRAPEARTDKRPQLSDLRESGALEQDADVVLMIYRDEFYNPTPDNEGLAEIIVTKQRNGPTGTVELAFIKEHSRFQNLERRRQTGGEW